MKLFATVDRLTNPPASATAELLCNCACKEFASFFRVKVQKITQSISVSAAGSVIPLCAPDETPIL